MSCDPGLYLNPRDLNEKWYKNVIHVELAGVPGDCAVHLKIFVILSVIICIM